MQSHKFTCIVECTFCIEACKLKNRVFSFSTGIGKAIALGLAQRGAHVIAISRTASRLEDLKKESPNIETVACDIENLDDLKKKVQPHLPVHMLVNNAGTNILEDYVDVTPESFDKYAVLYFYRHGHSARIFGRDFGNF